MKSKLILMKSAIILAVFLLGLFNGIMQGNNAWRIYKNNILLAQFNKTIAYNETLNDITIYGKILNYKPECQFNFNNYLKIDNQE